MEEILTELSVFLDGYKELPYVKIVKHHIEGDIPYKAPNEREPRDIPGIYIWTIMQHDKEDILYIGQSTCIPQRLYMEVIGKYAFIGDKFSEKIHEQVVYCPRFQLKPALVNNGNCDCIPRLCAHVIYLKNRWDRYGECMNKIEYELINHFSPPFNKRHYKKEIELNEAIDD